MRKAVILTSLEVQTLDEILDYLLSDDKEKNDFKEHHGHHLFDSEHDDLILNHVPSSAKSHIYFKTIYMKSELWNAVNS